MPGERDESYGLPPQSSTEEREAPSLPYRPANPARYRPRIGLVGCGGISVQHLRAYRAAGYDVAVLCDRHEERAREAQKSFYPEALVCTDYREVLRRDDVEVVDLVGAPGGPRGPLRSGNRGREAHPQPEAIRHGPRSRGTGGGPRTAGRGKAGREPERALGPPLELDPPGHRFWPARPGIQRTNRGELGPWLGGRHSFRPDGVPHPI